MTAVLDTAQVGLSIMFDDLMHVKNFKRKDFDSRKVTYFQYNLGKVLIKLGRARNNISKEERRLISEKKRFSPKWFATRMKQLSVYRSSVDRCIYIGKALGDAFAWHFYKGNESQLFKHLEHEEIKFPPTGIGGMGELIFIRDRPFFSGHLCILHSNTSLLRYGDVSLIDIKTGKLFAVGEIKTEKKSEHKLSLSLSLIGQDGHPAFKEEFLSDPKITPEVHERKFDKDRYKRQIKNIGKYFKSVGTKDPNHDRVIYDTYYTQEFEKLVTRPSRKGVNILKVSDGLAFVAIDVKPTRFSKHLFGPVKKPDPSKYDQEFTELVQSLQSPEPINFQMQFGKILYDDKFQYSAALGTAPLFWYPIKAAALKKVYMQEVFVMTLFNPGFLFRDLREIGLDFIKPEDGQPIFFGMIMMDKKQVRIEYMNFFLGLVKNHLQSEKSIIGALKTIISFMETHKDKEIPIRAEMEIFQVFESYNIDI